MIVRIFETAVDPDDVERHTQLFNDQVAPTFDGFQGCHGIESLVGLDEHAEGLVTIAAISRWDSMEVVRKATSSPQYKQALAEIHDLFRQTPLVRHFEMVAG